ncbi:YcaQ family DNA glycosylase [Mobilitalea sibirica]|uniref:YcaQ family DNA glycosylase n=1 Tax=Mobilitalea sibirica TaxID=1462919 RepID=A0A8J7H6Y5_9FIRM|nr:crosslink repair DNA glycosylase YcaQ family protein [Mobilitalea sibirica]MBH1940816.1 YcaQ family DNA glycosylase [Mobilitalea sibirica]
MDYITLSNKQARQFILLKQGLLGDYKFIGKEGVLEFVRQAGCIQYDPIDVCGKNADLVLQSRVKGFKKDMLYELLYRDRLLIDYFDKNLSIMETKDWPYFERIREAYRRSSRGQEEVGKVADNIKAIIKEKGPVCSKDIDLDAKVDWYWSETKLSRAALETLYFRGDLIIHHKKGTMKYYALAEDFIPKVYLEAEEPFPEDMEFFKWRVLRRISAVGLLWNKPSDAWLAIWDLKADLRKKVFEELLIEEKIMSVHVEGSKDTFYCLTEDKNILEQVLSQPKLKKRTELIAPLDSFLWDRKLIKEIFGFEYKWEIYTPVHQRNYGYYVLPILSGDRFIGRIEAVADRKENVLNVKKMWLEQDISLTKGMKQNIDRCLRRFMKFHELEDIKLEEL